MADPKNNKHKNYCRYAVHCLGIAPRLSNQETDAINREMALEWVRLADDIVRQQQRL